MKKTILLGLIVFSLFACKKQHMSPEGPTDVRIRNLSDQLFTNVTVITSENKGDTLTFEDIAGSATSDYHRFTKAYPKAEISAKINIGGNVQTYSTGPVSFTYMQYIGQDRITYEVYISNPANHVLTISNVIEEEPLVLK